MNVGRLMKYMALVAFAFPCISCAGMISGTTDRVTVVSNPSKAQVYVVGQDRAVGGLHSRHASIQGVPQNYTFSTETPTTLTLDKKINWTIHVVKEGYHPKVFMVTKSTDPNIWWNATNLFFGAFLDAMMGTAWKADPGSYSVELRKSDEGN